MKKYLFSFLLFFGLVAVLSAQNQSFTLEEIWGGAFRTEGMDVLHSMKNGKQYTILNFNSLSRSTTVDKYDYSTLEKIETVVSSADLDELRFFLSYEFSEDESKLLITSEIKQVYRKSSIGKYYVYDIPTKSMVLVSDNLIRAPTFSPYGSKVAYVFENNIYIKDLLSGTTTQVTTDGEKNKIINGVTDWVYEEEFAFVRAYEWNNTGTHIAFIRFDETEVPEFSMDIYGEDLYPVQHVFKYPKAGENNAEVSLHTYDIGTKVIKKVDLGDTYYIPRIKWTHEAHILSAQVLNRHQNNLKLYFHDIKTGKSDVVLEETDKAYIDITDYLTFL